MNRNHLWRFVLCGILAILIFQNYCISAQDTVRYQDKWYGFNDIGPRLWIGGTTSYPPDHNGEIIPGFLVQPYHFGEAERVYGIAALFINENTFFSSQENNWDVAPRVVIYTQDTINDSLWAIAIDSVPVTGMIMGPYFEYPSTANTYDYTVDERTVRSHEYYFDHPYDRNIVTEKFYIGQVWVGDRYNKYYEYVRENQIPWEESFFWHYSQTDSLSEWHSHVAALRCNYLNINLVSKLIDSIPLQCSQIHSYAWGLFFPIMELRCVKPYLWLEERGSTEARVRWTQAEAGIEYEVAWGRYGAEPDSCPSVLLTDTTFALTGLEPGSRNAVWVRKACHYATPGYDTVVWSDWSRPTVFLTLGVGEAEEAGVSVTARRGAVEVSCAEADAAVQVYDMAGRLIAAARTKADSPLSLPVPSAGVYTVRVGSGPAHKVVVF